MNLEDPVTLPGPFSLYMDELTVHVSLVMIRSVMGLFWALQKPCLSSTLGG